MVVAQYISSKNKKVYIHNLLMVATLPYYQLVIFNAYYNCCQHEAIAAQFNCSQITFALRRAWLYVELGAFLVNILQMMIGLCKKLKPYGGGNNFETPFIVNLLGEDYKAELE